MVRRHRDIEILVNNLGIFEPKPSEEIQDSDRMRFFEVNVLSGARLARLCLPAMKRAKKRRLSLRELPPVERVGGADMMSLQPSGYSPNA